MEIFCHSQVEPHGRCSLANSSLHTVLYFVQNGNPGIWSAAAVEIWLMRVARRSERATLIMCLRYLWDLQMAATTACQRGSSGSGRTPTSASPRDLPRSNEDHWWLPHPLGYGTHTFTPTTLPTVSVCSTRLGFGSLILSSCCRFLFRGSGNTNSISCFFIRNAFPERQLLTLFW